ncbi:MAG: phage tail tube protein [Alphaproteobacteria bacterium]|nr:phage tail tube protein [Alphaproteobacteria bacterium]
MPSFKGRDLLLKIGDGGDPENFTTIGAARTAAMTLDNRPVDATAMDDNGVQAFAADAGVQSLQIRLDGLFKDAAAEESLRGAAFGRVSVNYQLVFPNGDSYEAAFVVRDYTRGGTHDGLETFSVTLLRSGGGTYTAA